MAYLGPKPSQTLATPTSQYFNGTGSQTVFTLNRAVNVSEDLEVFVNNIQQEPGVGKSYTASGTTLTFDAAPSSGTANVYVVYRGLAEVTTRLEHDPNAALAATTGTFTDTVTADGVHSEYNGVSDNMTTSPTASGVQIGSFTNGYSAVEIAGTSGGFIDFSSADGTDFDGRILYAHSNDSMQFYTSGTTERLRIDSSGNVGIGVTPFANNIGKGLDIASGAGMFGSSNSNYLTGNLYYSSGWKYKASASGSMALLDGAGSIKFFNAPAGSANGSATLTERLRIDTSGNVGIGNVSPSSYYSNSNQLVVGSGAARQGITIASSTTTIGQLAFADGTSGDARYEGWVIYDHNTDHMSFGTSASERLRIDAAGNVTIQPAGTTTRSFGETVAIKVDQGAPTRLSVRNDSVNATASAGTTMSASGNSWAVECGSSAKNGNALTFAVDATAATPSVKMRLNTDGRWWVGQAVGTTLNGNGGETVTGIMHYSTSVNSYTVIQSNGSNAPLYVTNGPNRTGNNFIHFGENGSYTGGIGTAGGRLYIADNTQNTGISFYQACLVPTNINGTVVDNVYDCGHPSYRWDDIRATNGTIQTSDANEKQQIAALTDVEMTAAKAISQLFKTYKWNSAVGAKGDAARTHTGVIAQDVEAAMTAAGLNAGDYAFFISNTWWETQTEVPAVEAVDAVDAVYEDVVIPAVEEELDEDGNVIVEAQPERTEHRLVSEGIRAVEAVAAYTRTDVYDTAEEAPESATERTRMGIRYPELLAFIGAATEQRLSNIETRLAALEAN